MLETLVSSRIRRALFEYILAHPSDRFYLRGVAKELGLSISPLRRELKRLEHLGMLRSAQEGNMLFYTVDAASPIFLQLKQAGLPAQVSSESQPEASQTTAPLPTAPHLTQKSPDAAVSYEAAPAIFETGAERIGALSEILPALPAGRRSKISSDPLPPPALVGVATVGLGLMMIVTSLFYLRMTHQRLASDSSRSVSTQPSAVTVVVSPQTAAGTMRSSRWRVVPGGFGGFSSGASTNESY